MPFFEFFCGIAYYCWEQDIVLISDGAWPSISNNI